MARPKKLSIHEEMAQFLTTTAQNIRSGVQVGLNIKDAEIIEEMVRRVREDGKEKVRQAAAEQAVALANQLKELGLDLNEVLASQTPEKAAKK